MSDDLDPLTALRAQLAAGAGKPAGLNVPIPLGGQNAPVPSVTHETVFQRARYFENLVEHQFAHIRDLERRLLRTGTAAPTLPHFPPLKSAAGDFNPNDR
jgi:hypothetical protein